MGSKFPNKRPADSLPKPPAPPPAPHTADPQEVVLQLDNGYSLRSGLYDPEDNSLTCGEYVRLCDTEGNELLYWDQEEWQNEPALVMGAIINAAANADSLDQCLNRGKRTQE